MGVSIWEGSKAQELIDAIANAQKIDKQQGTANAGKALVVGSDGLVGFGNAGMSDTAKEALLNCFQHVYFDDGGKQAYNELRKALYGNEDIYELLYTITGFAKCIGYVLLPANRYNSDPSEIAACASLDSYSLQVGDKIKFEGDTSIFAFSIGTNNPDASSDGNWKIPLSTPYEYIIEASHLSDCRVVDIRKKDGSTISASELATINQSVNVYRKESD